MRCRVRPVPRATPGRTTGSQCPQPPPTCSNCISLPLTDSYPIPPPPHYLPPSSTTSYLPPLTSHRLLPALTSSHQLPQTPTVRRPPTASHRSLFLPTPPSDTTHRPVSPVLPSPSPSPSPPGADARRIAAACNERRPHGAAGNLSQMQSDGRAGGQRRLAARSAAVFTRSPLDPCSGGRGVRAPR